MQEYLNVLLCTVQIESFKGNPCYLSSSDPHFSLKFEFHANKGARETLIKLILITHTFSYDRVI